MSHQVKIYADLIVEPKTHNSLLILCNNKYRYSQAKLHSDTIRYYKSGVSLFHAGDNEIDIRLSCKMNSDNEYIEKNGRKHQVSYRAIITKLVFDNIEYTTFPNKIGFDSFAIEMFILDTKTGKISITADVDMILDTKTFKIIFPIGQELI